MCSLVWRTCSKSSTRMIASTPGKDTLLLTREEQSGWPAAVGSASRRKAEGGLPGCPRICRINPKPARPQLRPGGGFRSAADSAHPAAAAYLVPVHKMGSRAVWFGKLPHHRLSHPNSPFPLLYVGATIQTCLWEYFGDDVFHGKRAISSGKWQGCCLSQIVVPEFESVRGRPGADAGRHECGQGEPVWPRTLAFPKPGAWPSKAPSRF